MGLLVIDTRFLDGESRIYAVAEVDDANKKDIFAAVEISSAKGDCENASRIKPVQFRIPPRKRKSLSWPRLCFLKSKDKKIKLDGIKLFKGTDLYFKRWSHVRFVGGFYFYSIILQNRIQSTS